MTEQVVKAIVEKMVGQHLPGAKVTITSFKWTPKEAK